MGRRKSQSQPRGNGGSSRRVRARPPRNRILLVVEGEKTEPEYFKWVNSRLEDVHLEVKRHGSRSAPEHVVSHALEIRTAERSAGRHARDVDDYDTVWCIVDVDTHPNLSKALARAEEAELRVAVSVPCFETWLILHLRDHAQHVDPQASKKLWESVCEGRRISDGVLAGQLGEAMTRAAQLRKRHGKTVPRTERNPSTEVDELFGVIGALMGKPAETLY